MWAPPLPCPLVEAVPREEDFYDSSRAMRSGMTTFVCPAELIPPNDGRAQEIVLAVSACWAVTAVARVRRPRLRHPRAWVLETNVVPGLTETSLLPQAADAAGIGFDDSSSVHLLRGPREPGRLGASPAAKSSGETWSRNSLNFSTTSSDSSTSCSNSIADSEMTSSAA